MARWGLGGAAGALTASGADDLPPPWADDLPPPWADDLPPPWAGGLTLPAYAAALGAAATTLTARRDVP